jgi:bifunctional UDP-N-acetylglucosamine pyrophosphorylase/glucosamine-1-phosphate N-acetyltransferase
MKSDLVKVMHPLGERPMISWPVQAAKAAGAGRIVLVVGHQGDRLKELFGSDNTMLFAEQAEQLGTGHAVACARGELAGFSGTVLILCGDVPLIRAATLQAMLSAHNSRGAAVSVLTTHLEDPFGYGRVIKREGGRITRIVEEKDATEEERAVTEINSGIYCVSAAFLFNAVANLKNDNAQGEYYLTDIIKAASLANQLCLAYQVDDPGEVMGVNDRQQLAVAAAELRRRINEELMLGGVTLIDPATTYIETEVVIGRDTTIYPNVHISGRTVIGSGCIIEPGALSAIACWEKKWSSRPVRS